MRDTHTHMEMMYRANTQTTILMITTILIKYSDAKVMMQLLK